jgi:hypothetical protein
MGKIVGAVVVSLALAFGAGGMAGASDAPATTKKVQSPRNGEAVALYGSREDDLVE